MKSLNDTLQQHRFLQYRPTLTLQLHGHVRAMPDKEVLFYFIIYLIRYLQSIRRIVLRLIYSVVAASTGITENINRKIISIQWEKWRTNNRVLRNTSIEKNTLPKSSRPEQRNHLLPKTEEIRPKPNTKFHM